MPLAGAVTVDHVSSTVRAPGVALEIVGAESVARIADAFAWPVFDQYAKAPAASRLSAITVVAAIRRGLLERFRCAGSWWGDAVSWRTRSRPLSLLA